MKRTTFRIIILILPLFFLFSIPSAAQEWQTSSEIARDGTFIAYGNGVVKDRKTGLEWVAGPDMDMTWNEAKSWVNNLNIAGGGWRMPKIAELKTLYQKGTGTRNMTTLLKTTGWWIWSGETKVSSSTWGFSFNLGYECWGLRDLSGVRVFAVRSGNKEKLEMAKLPPTPSFEEIARDGHYIAYDNGTVKDTLTGLMWASKDNGRSVNWQEAKEYCESYRGGGYTDWRMPTQDELVGLYDKNKPGYRQECFNKAGYEVHITKFIHLSCCCPWASETRGSRAAKFNFFNGYRFWPQQSDYIRFRALPVRSGKKEKLEMAKLPSTPSLKEIPRDGRFLAYDNGTVLDTKTGLMWAAKDNGRNINWLDAKKYCENYRGGGYSDWRMPTVDELASLYDENKSYQAKPNSYIVHLTELIQLTTRCPWASETRGSWAAYFHFLLGYRSWVLQSYSGNYRALPVRSGN